MRILLYGYGNPSRQDDALGIRVVEGIEEWAKEKGIDFISVDSNYQLNLEDAANIIGFDIVIFADASVEEDFTGFKLTRLDPATAKIGFSTHSVSPAYVTELCASITDKVPEAFMLHLKGYEWDMKEELTEIGAETLENALTHLKERLLEINKLLEVDPPEDLIARCSDLLLS